MRRRQYHAASGNEDSDPSDLAWRTIESLRALGGSGRSSEIDDAVVERMGITEAQQSLSFRSGTAKLVTYISTHADWGATVAMVGLGQRAAQKVGKSS